RRRRGEPGLRVHRLDDGDHGRARRRGRRGPQARRPPAGCRLRQRVRRDRHLERRAGRRGARVRGRRHRRLGARERTRRTRHRRARRTRRRTRVGCRLRQEVDFPTVAPLSIPSPPPEWRFFELGTWTHAWLPLSPGAWRVRIDVYALALLVGAVVGIIVSNARLTARGGGPWIVIDLAVWGVAGGIIGARAWHVVTHPDDYFAGQEWWK